MFLVLLLVRKREKNVFFFKLSHSPIKSASEFEEDEQTHGRRPINVDSIDAQKQTGLITDAIDHLFVLVNTHTHTHFIQALKGLPKPSTSPLQP